MIGYIIFGIGFILWLWFVIANYRYDDLSDVLIGGLLTLIVTVMICGFSTFLSFIGASIIGDSSFEKTSEKELVSLQDGGSMSGKFFLGSGNINGSMKYVYMTKDNDEMQMKQLDVSDAVLIYSNELKVEKYETFFNNRTVEFLFGKQPLVSDYKYKIYVPQGTVKEQYNVDLQ